MLASISSPLRRVGIIDCFQNRSNLAPLLRAVRLVGGSPVVVRADENDWESRVRASPIRHWIVSGSEWNVIDPGAPRIPSSLLSHHHQRWLFICYGMQSLLFGMGGRIKKLDAPVRRVDEIDGGLYWRNHAWGFFSHENIQLHDVTFAADGCMMRGFIGNAMLTQYHPERTLEGLEQMEAFLRA